MHIPICPLYGFAALALLAIFKGARLNFARCFCVGSAAASLLELSSGLLFKRVFGIRFWDYRNVIFNIDGYVCLPFSALWGLLSAFFLLAMHPFVLARLRTIEAFLLKKGVRARILAAITALVLFIAVITDAFFSFIF